MLHDHAIEATYLERESGYAERILKQYPLAAGDVLLVASNGGRNAVPVEMVLGARERGVKTVALTNLSQSRQWPSRHSSGKRLFEVADLVIDNCGVDGDAAVTLPGFDLKIGPPSSITGMLIMNLIVVQAIEDCLKGGGSPEVFVSSNTKGDDHNDVMLQKYRSHIRHL